MSLDAFSSSFDTWAKNPEITNGIAKEIFTTNQKGDKKTHIFKLVDYKKISKYVLLPKECNNTIKK